MRHGSSARALIQADARLVPIDARPTDGEEGPAWGRRSLDWEGVTARDRAAGDGRYLFFTPLHPAFGLRSMACFAFDPGDLARCGRLRWRPEDLLDRFNGATYREYPGIVRCYSIAGDRLVQEMVRLEARSRLRTGGDLQAVREARRLLEPHARARCEHPGGHWSSCLDVLLHPFRPSPCRWPRNLFGTTELLCRGTVPVRAARFWREDGIWHPMAKALEGGR
jgi:hypothetical protein